MKLNEEEKQAYLYFAVKIANYNKKGYDYNDFEFLLLKLQEDKSFNLKKHFNTIYNNKSLMIDTIHLLNQSFVIVKDKKEQSGLKVVIINNNEELSCINESLILLRYKT